MRTTRCCVPLVFFMTWALACSKSPKKEAPARAEGRPRVVSLTPSMTEIVDALGAIDLVVGVDKYSALPAVQHLPKVGDFLSPNLEAIAAFGSDTLVLLDAVQTNVIEGLRSAKIRFLALPIQTIADVRAALRSVGDTLGRGAAADAAIARLDERLAA